jgi:hypothetical protein
MRRTQAASVLFTAFVSLSACGSESVETGPSNTTTLHPDAPPLPGETECKVVEATSIEVESAQHVPTCTPVSYETNPPSGGNHWAVWAAFKKYDTAVPREMYVHDLEHGAIVFAFRCKEACPDVVAALSGVIDEVSDGCDPPRVILTPDPDLPTPIAAAAWGATYTATCIDAASLAAFAKDHIGHGPEDVCTDGADVSSAMPCP